MSERTAGPRGQVHRGLGPEMDVDLLNERTSTDVGSYFVANYPPFSVWSAEHLPEVHHRLDAGAGAVDAGSTPSPLGLYLHIPFCRKRCKFCYFRVYTDKNSSDVEVYLRALAREAELYARRAAVQDRNLDFVYFGGGTPSFLSSEQLEGVIDRIADHWSWSQSPEVTFECEPGTLKKSKLETIKAIGTTRLSLGIEHFDDDVLTLNGRAHRSPEVYRAYGWARDVGFAQINVDLIAGMLGDTESKWKRTVDEALRLEPDSVTIYQMELPHNTVISKEAKDSGSPPPVADWPTKRAWVDYAFRQFEAAGYGVSSAYTVTRPEKNARFVYRDAVWRGADMIGLGVASFSHVAGVHFQNADQWENYVESLLDRSALPVARAYPMTNRQRLIRELILQLKLGEVDAGYFRDKFSVDIMEAFGDAFTSLYAAGLGHADGDAIHLSRAGLLRVDELLPLFFEPQFRDIRYT